MKKTVTITGTIELTRQEISKAIIDYLRRESGESNLSKVTYLYDEHRCIEGCLVKIEGSIDEGAHSFPEIKQSKKRIVNKHVKKNIGLFKELKEVLDKNTSPLHVDTIYKELSDNFPHLTKNHLNIYLHDKRMLPGTKFSAVDGFLRF